MSQTPLVSVVMPAFNSAQWVEEAVASVLSQTLRNLELIVVDDASTDSTSEILSGIADSRVKLVRLERNSGSAAARNRGIDIARGEFVALMDSDDVALPYWLERQVGFLKRNPGCGIRGAWVRTFGSQDGIWTPYESHDHIKADLLFRCGMNQNTIVFRRDEMNRLGMRYDENYIVAQDYELWTRCIDHMKFSNAQEVLVKYRVHSQNASVGKKDKMLLAARQIRLRQIGKLGLSPTEHELEIHQVLGQYGPSGPRTRGFDVDRVERWLLKLKHANDNAGYVAREALGILLYEYWRRCCKTNAGSIDVSIAKFFRSGITDVVPKKRKLLDTAKIIARRQLYSLPR